MKRIFRKIHLWLSLPAGLLISLICLSGAALVYEEEIMEHCRQELYFVKVPAGQPLPLEQLIQRAKQILPDSVSITGITIPSDPTRTCRLSLSTSRRGFLAVDPYTGEVKGLSERAPFFTFMFRLHRWLLDSKQAGDSVFIGKKIVGISTLLFVVILLSGIVVWIPKRRRMLKNRLQIAMRHGPRRFWYDLHVSGGMYAGVFLLAMALTGLTWSFPWYRTLFYKAFGAETSQAPAHGHTAGQSQKRPANAGNEKSFRYWQEVYEQLVAANPGYKQIALSHGSATVSFSRWGNRRATDRYMFNSQTGEITQVILYAEQEASAKLRGWIYSVHVGSWGGEITRLLSFLAALLGGTLPLTGYYFWARKLWKRKQSSQ